MYNNKAYIGGNGDLWHKLGKALGLDPDRVVEVKHIESHLSWEEAEQKGYCTLKELGGEIDRQTFSQEPQQKTMR